ncbi:KAP family P-loop NTPase fold protein [Cereibacter sphaeroides]|uniref:KAP family P-loop NTPase fold protein n=1 Tax=Cereibacter sphaeroides TaxID=1063 RepID=UPI003FCC8DB0
MIEDAPLKAAGNDKLGFGQMACHLASSFVQNDLSRGFVIGVEGSWGSGKSSLVNLALAELSEQEDGPLVVKFAPWLVGNRNELLAQLFSTLEPVILASVPAAEKDETKALLGRYAKASSGLAVLADLAETGGMPWAGVIAKLLRTSGKKAAELSERSLGELNEELRTKLKKLERPIIVFIDDLDRLEPTEAAEVLRLVKAVADFPNVAYVLAYDADVLAKSIEGAVGISDGKAYLEKVIQASFKVPRALSFDLRNWLRSEVLNLVDGLNVDPKSTQRLEGVFHEWCRYFVETPRDVVRIVNSLKLNYMPVRGHVDPGDMVFLQIVKTKNSRLFNWIESYVSDLSAIGDWGHIADGSHESTGEALLAAIGKEGEGLVSFVYSLEEHLPGIDATPLHQREGREFKVFSISDGELSALNAGKRLASPNHYRYFFSFSAPSGTVSDSELDQFLRACESHPNEALARFRQMIEIQRPQGGRLAEVLIDRVVADRARIGGAQVKGLFWILGEALDELIPFAKTKFGRPSFLQGDRREIFGLIARVEEADLRLEILRTLFSGGKSVAWLTGIIRQANFEHGTEGKRSISEDDRLLSTAEFDLIKSEYLKRLNETDPCDLLLVSNFLSLMYAWHALAKEDALNWISQQTTSAPGFLDVLDKMRSWSESSSVGVQYKLRSETLEVFFGGVSTARNRLMNMVADNNVEASLRSRAEVLLGKFDYDE